MQRNRDTDGQDKEDRGPGQRRRDPLQDVKHSCAKPKTAHMLRGQQSPPGSPGQADVIPHCSHSR